MLATSQIFQEKKIKVSSPAKQNDICSLPWILRKTPFPSITHKNSISLIDLYSGCGGMSLGVKEALRINNFGLNIKLALDVDESSLNVYKKNFYVNSKIALKTDISNFVSSNIGKPFNSKEKAIRRNYGTLDILVAGPPCQGHSNLNNHTRRNDPRNELYLNAIRFVEILKPRVAIIENVSTVIHDKDQVVNRAQLALEKIGYKIQSIVIDTADYGLAQSRKRHFQIALLNSTIIIDLQEFLFPDPLSLSDYIGDLVTEHTYKNRIFYTPSNTKEINRLRIDYLFDNNLYDLPDHARPLCHKTKDHSYKSCYGRMYWQKPAQTITSGFGSVGQGRYIHPIERRVITPHEAARIQGFPDFFDFSDVSLRGDLHTMIANAVPPKIIAIIIASLFKAKLFIDGKN